MAMITQKYIVERIKKTIDQYYSELKYMSPEYRKESELHYIGGILQTALHLLPTDEYYKVKDYVYEAHGYDPGGRGGAQADLQEYLHYKEEGEIHE